MMMKDIKGYEGQYAVTADGRVWSYHRNIFLTHWNEKKGYKRVGLRNKYKQSERKCFLVHRLVAEAFLPNLFDKAEVNHKNSIRDDNRVENLEWATRSENNAHAWKYGNKVYVQTEKHLEAVRKNIVLAKRAQMAKINERNLSHAT